MKGRKSKRESLGIFFVSAVFVFVIIGAISAIAAPNPPGTVSVDSSGRRQQTLTTGVAVPAQAGNVSQLTINDVHITNHWQGYYGSITGKITLDDAINNTIFDWKLASPQGEVYFSNASLVTWANITCVNFTSNISGSGTRSKLNNSIVEATFNIGPTEVDTINNTFNYTYTSSFGVGATTIGSSYNCPLTYTYVNNASQQSNFKEVLLTDNISTVFTTILEQDQLGFNGGSWDFQAIVPEDQNAGTTDFYVYVELT